MSTHPRLPAAVPGQAETLASVLAHTPDSLRRFFELYGEFWQHGAVDPALKEMTRLRNARITDCGF